MKLISAKKLTTVEGHENRPGAVPSSPSPFSAEYRSERETRHCRRGGYSKVTGILLCGWIAVSFGGALSVSIANANPLQVQEDEKSLLGLLMKYIQVVELGPENSATMQLRSRIEEKLKAGERCDRDEVIAALDSERTRYRKIRAELGDSHADLGVVSARIATLTELLAHEPEYLATHLDEVARAKGNWVSGVLYVTSGRHTGFIHRFDPEATEIELAKGSDDGLKVGMHFHVYLREAIRAERWLPDGKSYILGEVVSVEPKQSKVKLQSSIPKTPMPSTICYTHPTFTVGGLILAIRFDEAAWQNRPLMNAFLGELLHKCTNEVLEKPKIIVPDTPRSICEIKVLPIGRGGFSPQQQRTLETLQEFVNEQPYFSNVNFKSPVATEKTATPAAEK